MDTKSPNINEEKEEISKETNPESKSETTPQYKEIAIQTDEEVLPMHKPPATPPKNLLKSITVNWFFYLSLIACCYYVSIHTHYSFKQAILSIIFISMIGYFTHMSGHYISTLKMYEANDNYITNNTVLDCIARNLCHFMDFHDTTHHDSDINKQPLNVLYEFINNFILQGGLIAFFAWTASNYCLPTIILWALMYATVHNINYILMPPKTHQNHHENKHSSYGLDIWDILFNTKADPDEVEVYNHMSINMILITLGIVYYYKHYS